MHDYLSKAKSSNAHYFVFSIGTVRGNPFVKGFPVVAGEKEASSLMYYMFVTVWGPAFFGGRGNAGTFSSRFCIFCKMCSNRPFRNQQQVRGLPAEAAKLRVAGGGQESLVRWLREGARWGGAPRQQDV
jgi:hypothetical protein